jgi:hypothetical protein
MKGVECGAWVMKTQVITRNKSERDHANKPGKITKLSSFRSHVDPCHQKTDMICQLQGAHIHTQRTTQRITITNLG